MDFQCFVKFMDYIELKLVLEMQNKGHRVEVGLFITSQLCFFNNDSLVLKTFHGVRALLLFH